MRDKIDFPYNLYIGKHMEKPLIVKYRNLHSDNVVGCLTGVNRDYLFIKNGGVEDIEIYTKHCKPHLKLPEDLTDSEIHYIFDTQATTHKIHRDNDSVCVSVKIGCCGEEYDIVYNDDDQKLTQDQFNRLYACHSALNAEELIRKNLAIKIEVKNER